MAYLTGEYILKCGGSRDPASGTFPDVQNRAREVARSMNEKCRIIALDSDGIEHPAGYVLPGD